MDRNQLRDVTLDDPDLMREILDSLVDDTSRQLLLLEQAVRNADALSSARLAHYCKGACANVGARRAAAILLHIERLARTGDLDGCVAALTDMSREWELLRAEAALAVNGSD